MLNKSTEAAIAAMSRLAQAQCQGEPPLTATQIAEARNLQRPFVAKLLTVLSQQGLIRGTPGPNGGYRLARERSEISLLQIAQCFERPEHPLQCPFGPGYCGGEGPHCPLHDDLKRLQDDRDAFLRDTTLAVFCG
jgi:Rrf2 family protein